MTESDWRKQIQQAMDIIARQSKMIMEQQQTIKDLAETVESWIDDDSEKR
jgi:hypothetical protein